MTQPSPDPVMGSPARPLACSQARGRTLGAGSLALSWHLDHHPVEASCELGPRSQASFRSLLTPLAAYRLVSGSYRLQDGPQEAMALRF